MKRLTLFISVLASACILAGSASADACACGAGGWRLVTCESGQGWWYHPYYGHYFGRC